MDWMRPFGSSSASRKSAFTLIETLIVIGVLATLLAILMPSLARARESANRIQCASNLRQLGMGIIQYASANKMWLPASGAGGGETMLATNENYGVDWIGWCGPLPANSKYLDGSAIAPYVGHPNPLMTGSVASTPAHEISGMNPALFRCPSDNCRVRTSGNFGPGGDTYYYSYSMNEMLGTGYIQFSPYINPDEIAMSAPKLTQVRNPSTKVMLIEEDPGTVDDGNMQPFFYGNRYPALLSIAHSKVKKYDSWNDTSGAVPNASASGNACYCDGSVRFVTRAEVHSLAQVAPKY